MPKTGIPFELEPAAEADAARVLAWRNDPASRRNSLDTARVPVAAHRRWFRAKLADPSCRLLIARTRSGEALGQVRLDSAGPGTAVISIVVAPGRRGLGLGTAMLSRVPWRLGPRRLRRLIAYIRPENVASVVAFVKAGFGFEARARRDGALVYRMSKRRA